MNNPLTKGKFRRECLTAVFIGAAQSPRELAPAEIRRIHALHIRRKSLLKQIAFIDAQLARELKALLKT